MAKQLTKQEKEERAARLQREAEDFAHGAVLASGGDTGMSSEISARAKEHFWRKIAPTR